MKSTLNVSLILQYSPKQVSAEYTILMRQLKEKKKKKKKRKKYHEVIDDLIFNTLYRKYRKDYFKINNNAFIKHTSLFMNMFAQAMYRIYMKSNFKLD